MRARCRLGAATPALRTSGWRGKRWTGPGKTAGGCSGATCRPPKDLLELRANHTGKRFGPDVPDSAHPVARTHDESGRLALYVNPEFTSRIVGLAPAASRIMLYALWAHGTGLEFTYRHRWRDGDLAIWDNRSVMHTSILDYDEPRALTRVVVKGGVPV